ncbi:MAG: hypothetical protein ACM3PE_05635 [Deltaproteobacteria bacterium]
MFFSFLQKDEPHFPDLSLVVNYEPRQVIFYYYNSFIKVPLELCQDIKEIAGEEQNPDAPIRKWAEFLYDDLKVGTDLENLQNNEYLEGVGPYYYPLTNTRFYFVKASLSESGALTGHDMDIMQALNAEHPLNNELSAYQKTRKNGKKIARNEGELIKDINMCLASLREVEKINRHINYLNKHLQNRYSLVETIELLPGEPDALQNKPQKEEAEVQAPGNLISLNGLLGRRRKANDREGSFNHEMKIYIIRYREYEKACDRYKAVLENWGTFYQEFLDLCYQDIDTAEEKLRQAQSSLQIYNSIIVKSFVNSMYQDPKTLSTFRYYLETGRAHSIQDCMNLFEEESRWSEIKASQERIENTIYFLQHGTDDQRTAGEQVDQLLKRGKGYEEAAATKG